MVLETLPVYLLRFRKRCQAVEAQTWKKIFLNLEKQLKVLSHVSQIDWSYLQGLLEEERLLVKELILDYELLKKTSQDLIKSALLDCQDWQVFHQRNLKQQESYLKLKSVIQRKLENLKVSMYEKRKDLHTKRVSRPLVYSYTKANILDIIC